MSHRNPLAKPLLLTALLWSCRRPEPMMNPSVILQPSELTLSCEGVRRFVPQLLGGSTYPLAWRVMETDPPPMISPVFQWNLG